MKKLRNLKALLLVLATSCCVSGFAVACGETVSSGFESESSSIVEESGESDGSSDVGGEKQEGYAVYFDSGRDGEKVQVSAYETNETVTLPSCEDKTFGGYVCPFLHWAHADGTPVTEPFSMPEADVYLYAVYGNGMVSGEEDFYLTKDGYVAADASSHGALSNFSLENDGDVYAVDMTFPAVASQYSNECGLTFAAAEYSANAFNYYVQLFIGRATTDAAGNLQIYVFNENGGYASVKEVKLSSLAGTAYYNKFKNWMTSDTEETFRYSVRLDKTSEKFHIGVDGVELFSVAVGESKNNVTLTEDYLDHSIVGFRAKLTSVKFANPTVTNVKDYELTLDTNGGAFSDGGTERSFPVSEYEYAGLPTPVRDGYTFRGWYGIDKYGKETFAGEDSFALSSTITYGGRYYAKWTDNGKEYYTLSFDSGIEGYEIPSVLYYQLGNPVASPDTGSDEYSFENAYYYDKATTQIIDFKNFDLSKASVSGGVITVYAKANFLFAGAGTAINPYKLGSVDDWLLFAEKINGGQTFAGTYFLLTDNVDLNSANWTTMSGSFAGVLDGGNKTISGITVSGTGKNAGLFTTLSAGTIKNLVLNVNVTSTGANAGGLAAIVSGTVTLENITVNGSVTGKSLTGGFIGWTGDTVSTLNLTMTNCVNNATVTTSGGMGAGGIIGSKDGTKVVLTDCVNNGAIKANGTYAGGIAGILRAGTGSKISGCYNYGDVTATTASASYVGGITGCNRAKVENCYCYSGATITYGTTAQKANAYAATASAAPWAGYLVGQCTVTGATVTGGGLCDTNGNPV